MPHTPDLTPITSCDHCGTPLSDSRVHPVPQLRRAVTSANVGESASLCGICLTRLFGLCDACTIPLTGPVTVTHDAAHLCADCAADLPRWADHA